MSIQFVRTSQLTGITRSRILPVTEKQVEAYEWTPGMTIQEAFPNLPAGDREFIKSGITEEEWDSIFEGEE